MSLTTYRTLCTEVYEITKPVGRDYPDVPYFIRHLSQVGGRILEAMVGTGRLLIPLLEAGLEVEGIDASSEMLAACRRNCAARGLNPLLYEGIIEELNLGKFNAIVVSFGSFMLLGNRSSAIAALKTFAQHLQPNGRYPLCQLQRWDRTAILYGSTVFFSHLEIGKSLILLIFTT